MRLLEPLVSIDPRTSPRALVLTGTTVPVDAVLNWIKGGQSLDQIEGRSPGLRRAHLVAVLEAIREAALGLAVPFDDTPGALIVSDRERMSGTPTFARSRVPIDTLFDHVVAGDSLMVFLDDFPGITPEHAHAVMDAALAAAVAAAPRDMAAAE